MAGLKHMELGAERVTRLRLGFEETSFRFAKLLASRFCYANWEIRFRPTTLQSKRYGGFAAPLPTADKL